MKVTLPIVNEYLLPILGLSHYAVAGETGKERNVPREAIACVNTESAPTRVAGYLSVPARRHSSPRLVYTQRRPNFNEVSILKA